VRTAELPGQTPAPNQPSRQDDVGLALRPLTPELAERLGVAPGTHGLVISSVRPDAAAARAGLRPGDVLLSVDRRPVANARDALQQLAAARPGGHLLLIQRGDSTAFLVLEAAR